MSVKKEPTAKDLKLAERHHAAIRREVQAMIKRGDLVTAIAVLSANLVIAIAEKAPKEDRADWVAIIRDQLTKGLELNDELVAEAQRRLLEEAEPAGEA